MGGAGVQLGTLRVEIPCGSTIDAVDCWTNGVVAPSVQSLSGGVFGRSYEVTIRVRGVAEPNTYSGGTNDGAAFQTGGTPSATGYNRYSLTTSSPAATYYLNRGTSLVSYCVALDYTAKIVVDAAATVTLQGGSVDTQEHMNKSVFGTALVVDGIPPAPAHFNGQFVQVDVLSIAMLP